MIYLAIHFAVMVGIYILGALTEDYPPEEEFLRRFDNIELSEI